MTVLSVNLNKIALLRNSRGTNFPNLLEFAEKFIKLGVKGITIHPRPDQRHITIDDAKQLAIFLSDYPEVELNIEGYPSEDFLGLIAATNPHQCTLVPDAAGQLTSDHGWDICSHHDFLKSILARLQAIGCRSAIFVAPDLKQINSLPGLGADRIELYTESFAQAFNTPHAAQVLNLFKAAANQAQQLGVTVNAGHDLNLSNLGQFLEIPGIAEVSIGHALIVECIQYGMQTVIDKYLAICGNSCHLG